MRITNNIIKNVVTDVAGEDAFGLVMKIKGKKNVSEFKIAEAMETEINLVRNMLYRLFQNNLVHFMRKKDRKKGWYIYYWTFQDNQIKHLFFKLKKDKLTKLKERLQREQGSHFYMCDEQCMRLSFEQAMDFEFKCPECGHLIELQDNAAQVERIKREIHELENFFDNAERIENNKVERAIRSDKNKVRKQRAKKKKVAKTKKKGKTKKKVSKKKKVIKKKTKKKS